MLNESEFKDYCKRTKLSQAATEYVQTVRSSAPARRVGDTAKGNVCAHVPVPSIGQTVQTESRTCEAVFLYETELSADALEIWDQPRPLQLRRDKGSRGTHVSNYTPDYLVLRGAGPVLIECKPLSTADRLMGEKPDDWSFIDGQRVFVPAAAAAEQLGLRHEVYITDDTAPIHLANLEFLYALHVAGASGDGSGKLEVATQKLATESKTVLELCGSVRNLAPSTVYQWISNGQVFGPLKAQLLSQEDVFRVFATRDAAVAFEAELVAAMREQPCETGDTDLGAIVHATPQELERATTLLARFEEVVRGDRKPTRTEYRYRARYEAIVARNGNPVAAFLPKFCKRGNRVSRLTPAQDQVIADIIQTHYTTGICKRVTQLLGHVDHACEAAGVPRVSRDSLARRCKQIPPQLVAEGRLGNRGYHNALRPVTAEHATLRCEVPGLFAHVDSTQLDARVFACVVNEWISEPPWIYVLFDEACTRGLGAWIGLGKSDRFALALSYRDTARRQGAIPPYIFADRGAEFGSVWWETTLASHNVAKYMRPPGAPRFGGIQESGLKQINDSVATQLAGSTWADQHARSASGSKKSRATARLLLEVVGREVFHFIFEEWNKTRHGTADGTPDELWFRGQEQFGNVLRPMTLDRDFLISTSIPVDVKLGERKGLRVAYREYWSAEMDAVRKPLKIDDARIDPGTPSILYVKTRDRWFTTYARDHHAVVTLTAEGRFLENYRLRSNANASSQSRRDREAQRAARLDKLQASNDALPFVYAAVAPDPAPEPMPEMSPDSDANIDLDQYEDIPSLAVTQGDNAHVA